LGKNFEREKFLSADMVRNGLHILPTNYWIGSINVLGMVGGKDIASA